MEKGGNRLVAQGSEFPKKVTSAHGRPEFDRPLTQIAALEITVSIYEPIIFPTPCRRGISNVSTLFSCPCPPELFSSRRNFVIFILARAAAAAGMEKCNRLLAERGCLLFIRLFVRHIKKIELCSSDFAQRRALRQKTQNSFALESLLGNCLQVCLSARAIFGTGAMALAA
jgi:hypothetical protein